MTGELLLSDVFRNALLAATIASVTSGLVGYLVVLRAQAFAAESLLDVCFAGATGAALLGVSPLAGMAIFGLGAAAGIGALGGRAAERGVEIGMVVSLALGLGILFLSVYARESAAHSAAGVGILFGSLLSVRPSDIFRMAGMSVLVLGGLLAIFRPLLFATVDPDGARARGVPVRFVSIGFLLLLALAAASSALTVGVLLASSLLIAPAAAAARLTRRPARALVLSVCLAVGVSWGGIAVSFFWPGRKPPVGFSVSALAAALYFVAAIFGRAASRSGYARRGKTIIIGDSVETGRWTSKKGSTTRSRRLEKGEHGPGAPLRKT